LTIASKALRVDPLRRTSHTSANKYGQQEQKLIYALKQSISGTEPICTKQTLTL